MLYCVAVIVDNKGKEIGYRLLDTKLIGKGGTTKDLSVDAVSKGIGSNPNLIENLGTKNGKVVGVNGVLDRYTRVSQDNQPLTDPRMVILFRTETGFIVSDAFGGVSSVKSEIALELNKKYPIANGKVVHKDGNEFISSIVGEYPFIEAKKDNKPDTKILFLSDEDSSSQLVKKFETHANDRNIRVIGKLSFDNSSNLLANLFLLHGLKDYLNSGSEKSLLAGVTFMKDVAIPDLAKICDKKAIIDYAKGVKEVTKGVKTAKDATDLLMDLTTRMDSEKVKLV